MFLFGFFVSFHSSWFLRFIRHRCNACRNGIQLTFILRIHYAMHTNQHQHLLKSILFPLRTKTTTARLGAIFGTFVCSDDEQRERDIKKEKEKYSSRNSECDWNCRSVERIWLPLPQILIAVALNCLKFFVIVC